MLVSRLSLPRRLNMVFPKICTLSGRSRAGCMLLAVDLPDDFRDRVIPSKPCSHEGPFADARDRRDEDPDELAWWLWCLSNTDARLIRWLSARMLSGDGGPSIAGPMKSVDMSCVRIGDGGGGLTGAKDSAFDGTGPTEYLGLLGALSVRFALRSPAPVPKSYTGRDEYAQVPFISRHLGPKWAVLLW